MKAIFYRLSETEVKMINRLKEEAFYRTNTDVLRNGLRTLYKENFMKGAKGRPKKPPTKVDATIESLSMFCVKEKNGVVETEGVNKFCRYIESGIELIVPLPDLQ